MVRPGSVELSAQANSDRRRSWVGQSSVSIQHGEFGSRSGEASIGLEARPSGGILVSVAPTWRRSRDVDQYVATFDDPHFPATFGRRYLIGELDRRQLTIDTRFNLILSPNLSLQTFVQPLLSAGEFIGYKELQEPGTFRFRRYEEGFSGAGENGLVCQGGSLCRSEGRIHLDWSGDGSPNASIPEQDFNLRSLRGSAVLRWEYHPGSRLYLVWQQNRQGRLMAGDFDFGRDLRGLFDAPVENVFVIKVSRWLDL